jgi:sodium/pantothenate symporter
VPDPLSPLLLGAGESGATNSALISFGIYLLGVFFIAWLSARVLKGKEFLSEYFLGSRNLGMWAFALTFAATNASGGSFMGFPSLIYTHGWVLALWIGSYMIVPLVTMGLLAKRLNQVARTAGAITVPEVLRERFDSKRLGMLATLLLTFFMFFYLLAQFKAGSHILSTLLANVPLYQSAVAWVAGITTDLPWIGNSEPDYLLSLMVFAVTVILYTAYGGFRAVVWTDVMQGLVMVVGVIVMLFLVLSQVGGLGNATRQLARMTPPEHGQAILRLAKAQDRDVVVRKGTWLRTQTSDGTGIVRTASVAVIPAKSTVSESVAILKITTPEEIEKIQPDVLELEVAVEITELTPYRRGAGQRGVYVSAPGPDPKNETGFLSFGMAMSFFVFWAFGGAGQPSNMVRQMAFNNTATFKRSMVMVVFYYSLIYFPLVLIFCCARVLLPGMEADADRIMPEMATALTAAAGYPWLAGFLIAAPFAAVMSSVDSFLLMVSSGLVRDIYQRNINPNSSEKTLSRLSYAVTALAGIGAVLAVLNPPEYLQNLIVFATGGLAGGFLVPMALALYWPRFNAAGAVAGMLSGCGTHLLLYIAGYMMEGRFTVYQFLGVQPFIWDLLGSTLMSVAFTLAGPPSPDRLVEKFFGKRA